MKLGIYSTIALKIGYLNVDKPSKLSICLLINPQKWVFICGLTPQNGYLKVDKPLKLGIYSLITLKIGYI